MKQSYQTLFEMAIREAQISPVPFGDMVTEIFEIIMKLEREMFLKETDIGEDRNKANGFYNRFIPSFQGKLDIRIPRDRKGAFSPLLLEVARHQSEKCSELALELFTSGLSTRKIETVIQTMFGEKMSASKVSDIAQKIQPIREAWQKRTLDDGFFAIQIDAIRLHVRRKEVYNEACFIVMGIRPDGKREILGIYLFPEEGAHAWREVFSDLIDRGLRRIDLVISDELKGIVEAVEEYYPGAKHQLCLIHRKRNLINRIRADKKKEFSDGFNYIFSVDDPENGLERIEERLMAFTEKWKPHISNIDSCLEIGKLKNYAAFLHFPVGIRRMVYTTNWIERLNAHIRKITKRVPAFPSPDSLLNLVFMATQHFEDGPYKRHIPAFYKHLKPLYEKND